MTESKTSLFDSITAAGAKNAPAINALHQPCNDDADDSVDPIPLSKDDFQNLEREQFKLKIALQREYSTYVKRITTSWLCFIVVMFTFSGIANFFNHCYLSDAVLIGLIAGTSLGVIIGLSSIILHNLFPRDKKH